MVEMVYQGGLVITFLVTWAQAHRIRRGRSSLDDYVIAVMGTSALVAAFWPVTVPVFVLCHLSRRFDSWIIRGLLRLEAQSRHLPGSSDSTRTTPRGQAGKDTWS